jgi:hypothetical protein
MILPDNKPQPSTAAVLAAVLLLVCGGIWFLVRFISLVSLYASGTEVQGLIEKVYPGKFGVSITYSFLENSEKIYKEDFVILASKINVGDEIDVAFNQSGGNSYIKAIIVPNAVVYLMSTIALWAVALVGFIKKVIRKENTE